MKILSVKVAKKIREANNIVSFELVALNGEMLPAFEAGSHVDVYIKDNLIRQYSLCNDPAHSNCYRIAILRDSVSRGGSIAMHDLINEGDVIRISEPKNNFSLVNSKRFLLFAGGIGVTPILSMAQYLAQNSIYFEMHYCGRSLDSMAFLQEISSSTYADSVQIHVDDGDAEQRLNITSVLKSEYTESQIYVCGPAGFIDFVIKSAKDAGWPNENIHREYFGAANINEESSVNDFDFEVEVASTNQRYFIPKDKTIIEVLSENGIEIPVSCEAGVCGTCLTNILDGIPDHKDIYLSDAEHAKNDQFTPCCSRSKSAILVLDM
jgi:vanillate O-demethylase ferredoxin subunit